MTRYLILKDTDNESVISILEEKEGSTTAELKVKLQQAVQDEFMEDVEFIKLTVLDNSYKAEITLSSDGGEKYTRYFVLNYTAIY